METRYGATILKSIIAAPFNSTCIRLIAPETESNNIYIGDFVRTTNQTDSSGISFCTRCTPGDFIRGVVVAIEATHDYENILYRTGSVKRTLIVCEDPFLYCKMRVNGVLTTSDVNKFMNIDSGTGNTVTGLSNVSLDKDTLHDSVGQFYVLKIAEIVDTDDEQYTVVEGLISNHELLADIVSSVEQSNIYYVGKHGSDTNNGKSIEQAFLTITKGITEATADTPTSSNIFVVKANDAGIYSEDLLITTPWVYIDAKNSFLQGKIDINHNENSYDHVNLTHLSNTDDDCIYVHGSPASFQSIKFSIDTITHSGTGYGIHLDSTALCFLSIVGNVNDGGEIYINAGTCLVRENVINADITVKSSGILYIKSDVILSGTITVESGGTLYIEVANINSSVVLDWKDGANIYGKIDYLPSGKTYTIAYGVNGVIDILYANDSRFYNNSNTFKINTFSDNNKNTYFGKGTISSVFRVAYDLNETVFDADGINGIVRTKTLQTDGDNIVNGVIKVVDSSTNVKYMFDPNGNTRIRGRVEAPFNYTYDTESVVDTTRAITQSDSGTRFDNKGSSAPSIFNLPALTDVEDGTFYEFLVLESQTLTINTDGSDRIDYLTYSDISSFASALEGAYLAIEVSGGKWAIKEISNSSWNCTRDVGGVTPTNTIDNWVIWLNQGVIKQPSSGTYKHIAIRDNYYVINAYYDQFNDDFRSTDVNSNYAIRNDSNVLKISSSSGVASGSQISSWTDAVEINTDGTSTLQFPLLKIEEVTSSSTRNFTKADIGKNIVYNSGSNGTFHFAADADIPIGAYGYVTQINAGEVQFTRETAPTSQILQALAWNTTTQQFVTWVPASQNLYTIDIGSRVMWIKQDTNKWVVSGNLKIV